MPNTDTTAAATTTVPLDDPKPKATPRKKAARKPANGKPDPNDFFEILAQQEPQTFQVYVYRVWPKIDRQSDNHYIGKHSEPFDEDFLLRTYGSGKVFLKLNNSRGETIVSRTVALHDPKRPPKVNPLEVTTDPVNDTYFEVWAKRAEPAEHSDREPAGDDKATMAAIAVLEKTMDRLQANKEAMSNDEREMLKSSAQHAIDIVKSQQGQGSGDLVRLLEILLQQLGASRQSSGSEMAPFVQMMTSQLETQSKLVAELIRAQANREPAAAGGLGSVKETVELIQLLRSEFGPTPPPADQEWWEKLLPHVPQTMSALATIVQAQAGQQASQPGAQGATPKLGAPAANASQQPRSPSGGAESTQGSPEAPAAPQQPESVPDELTAFLSAIAGPLINYVSQGENGRDFAAWLADGYGEATFRQLQGLGKEMLLLSLQGYPPLWQHLAPHSARLTAFVDEFLQGPPPADDEGADDEPPQQQKAAA